MSRLFHLFPIIKTNVFSRTNHLQKRIYAYLSVFRNHVVYFSMQIAQVLFDICKIIIFMYLERNISEFH